MSRWVQAKAFLFGDEQGSTSVMVPAQVGASGAVAPATSGYWGACDFCNATAARVSDDAFPLDDVVANDTSGGDLLHARFSGEAASTNDYFDQGTRYEKDLKERPLYEEKLAELIFHQNAIVASGDAGVGRFWISHGSGFLRIPGDIQDVVFNRESELGFVMLGSHLVQYEVLDANTEALSVDARIDETVKAESMSRSPIIGPVLPNRVLGPAGTVTISVQWSQRWRFHTGRWTS